MTGCWEDREGGWKVADFQPAPRGWVAQYKRTSGDQGEFMLPVVGWLVLERPAPEPEAEPVPDGPQDGLYASAVLVAVEARDRRVVAGVLRGHEVVPACTISGLLQVKSLWSASAGVGEVAP